MTDELGYEADDITHLEGLDAVRKRPGMYIGGTGTDGRTHLVYEIIDNAVDEALAGYCTTINVTLSADGSVGVTDDGRGIPVGINHKAGISAVELVMTKLHAGGKFGTGGYKSAGGLHGVGASVVNALSHRTDVLVRQSGHAHELSFRRGKPGLFAGPGPNANFTDRPGLRKAGKADGSGTTITFWPDPAIFPKQSHIDVPAVLSRCRQTAFLIPGLTLVVDDHTATGDPETHTFQYTGGLADMVDHLTPAGTKTVTDPCLSAGESTFVETVPLLDDDGNMTTTDVERDVEVSAAWAWNTGYDTTVETFVNVVRTPNGGTHKKGFEKALLAAVRKAIAGTRGLMRASEDPPILDDVTEGLVAVVAVNVPEPQFVGQTKDALGTPAVTKCVQEVVAKSLADWLNSGSNKTQVRQTLEKIVSAARVRLTQKATKDAARRKSALESSSLPAKLADCAESSTDRSELLIVEGDSAAGSAKKGRDANYQAILPIRGKILNVQKATMRQMLNNAECSAIIQCMGAGMGKNFDLDRARYGRLVVLADADVDGRHIFSLLAVLAWRYMRPLVEAGRLFVAVPPLFSIKTSGKKSQEILCYSQMEMGKKVAALEKAGSRIEKISRNKGLGEMDAEDLWRTTMNPVNRTVKQITAADIPAAEAMLDLAMGDQVPPRRQWIADNSHSVDPEAIDA